MATIKSFKADVSSVSPSLDFLILVEIEIEFFFLPPGEEVFSRMESTS